MMIHAGMWLWFDCSIYRDREKYLNHYAHTLWALLKKKPSDTET